jgi:hypothetical protein
MHELSSPPQSSLSASTRLVGPTRKRKVSTNEGFGAAIVMNTTCPAAPLNVYRSALLPGRLIDAQSASARLPLTGTPGVIGAVTQPAPVPVTARTCGEPPFMLNVTLAEAAPSAVGPNRTVTVWLAPPARL